MKILFFLSKNLNYIGEIIEKYGLDFCYAGVGITGHLAFNDPIADFVDVKSFSNLSTRIMWLSKRTCVVNAVTAAKGAILSKRHI